ncbi:hypothetical protein [Staphylococcus capitis]|uniref:hypothetical protein n=1 Tax=Staphylococcus capitis TaxID=29388 RepID=UPI0011A72CB7|nr:hypothetical protein [Staphylococcus capitis]
MISKGGGIRISEGLRGCIGMILLNRGAGEEVENGHYLEDKGLGKIGERANEAMDMVCDLRKDEERVEGMRNQMRL